MRCAESLRLLDSYVDDQLEAGAVLGLQDHLRGCARCRTRELGLREVRDAVRRHTQYRVAPAGLRARIAGEFGAAPVPPPAAGRRRWAFAAARLPLLGGAQAKIVYHISSSERAGAALRTLNNHLEAAPGTKVIVVAHNDGVDFLLRGARDESGQLFETAVRQFKARGVEFRVCNNTLVRRKIDGGGILPEATLVPSGIAEIGRLQDREGYAYMRM